MAQPVRSLGVAAVMRISDGVANAVHERALIGLRAEGLVIGVRSARLSSWVDLPVVVPLNLQRTIHLFCIFIEMMIRQQAVKASNRAKGRTIAI